MITSRNLVYRTLKFQNNKRVPRQLWTLPWALYNHPKELNQIHEDFPDDIIHVSDSNVTSSEGFSEREPELYGRPFEPGEYTDIWGCKFLMLQKGVIGEVKEPVITGEDWENRGSFRIPYECIEIDKEQINNTCRNTDRFVLAGDCPRLFERLQFLRGTEQMYIDLMLKPKGMYDVIEEVHDFYCRLLTAWAETEVDALYFMDDWGAQRSLLINPQIWVEIFMPMYRDYVDIAHKHGKKAFMHSDGYILDIIPHLIEIGVDALNSQVFCMGLDKLSGFKGKITFWGEIDRQHLLVHGTQKQIEEAVKSVRKNLWANGGCIAQCEFGPGANPDNVYKVFEAWNSLEL